MIDTRSTGTLPVKIFVRTSDTNNYIEEETPFLGNIHSRYIEADERQV